MGKTKDHHKGTAIIENRLTKHVSNKHGIGLSEDKSTKKKEHYMELITVHFPPGILKHINTLISEGTIANRSEFIRQCVSNQIVFWNKSEM